MVTGTNAKQRLIDANAVKHGIAQLRMSHWFNNQDNPSWHHGIVEALEIVEKLVIDREPTVAAVPTEFVMENFNLEFVCDELTDCGEECSECCQYSQPQPECIHRYIDTIWRKEHEKIY